MAIYNHESTFAGKNVEFWEPGTKLKDPETTIYRLGVEYEDADSWTDVFASFLAQPNVSQITGLVVGFWTNDMSGDSAEAVEAIVAAQDKLPNLTALFLGDITMEESEISWINQSDVSPFFNAFPKLEVFRVRGGNGLSLGTLNHAHLKTLIVETGGMDVALVREVLGSRLPALEHLELWLGTENYGGNATVPDLAALFTEQPFPRLRYLGLRDSDIVNELAIALARSSILDKIRVLDLSLGVLDDTGVLALLNHPALLKLEKLDIHYHFCTEGMIAKLTAALEAAGVQLDASDSQIGRHGNNDEWRFVAVGE